jgi:hypothetical protein
LVVGSIGDSVMVATRASLLCMPMPVPKNSSVLLNGPTTMENFGLPRRAWTWPELLASKMESTVAEYRSPRQPIVVRSHGIDRTVLSAWIPGDTSASRHSQRYGRRVDQQVPAVHVDDDRWGARNLPCPLSGVRCRSGGALCIAGRLSKAQIGNAPGNFIPSAPAIIASAGITLGEKLGWYGGIRWRYLGEAPLTEDNAFRSPVTSIINGRAGHHFDNGRTVQLDALNLLNAKTNQITYAYGSLIKTDSLFNLCFPVQVAPAAVCQNGVMDRILHPIEPLALRMTVSKTF